MTSEVLFRTENLVVSKSCIVANCGSLALVKILQQPYSIQISFFPVLSQEIGWLECLRNDLFCVELDVKTLLSSVLQHF